MKSVKILKENLENETQLPVHLHPEFMTSLEAERLQGHNDMHDASAAAIILKSYLETKK
jgi:RNase H-fold protein (predicted Holliday junction resolvase)